MKRKSFRLITLVICVVVSLLLYSRSLSAEFVSDDWDWLSIARDRQTVMPDLLVNYAGDRSGGSYNPVSSLWVNALFVVFGAQSLPFHVASALLNGMNAWLVTLIAYQILCLRHRENERKQRGISLFAGFIFLVWPTHVEAVAWLASVPHLLAALFFLASLYWFIEWYTRGTRVHLVLSVFSALLAFMSKESAILLPFIFLAFVLWFRAAGTKQKQGSTVRVFVAYFFSAIAFGFLRFAATGVVFGSYAEPSFIVRPLTWLHTGLTFFEEMLTMGFGRAAWSAAFFTNPMKIGIFAVVVALLVCGYVWEKSKDGFFFLICFFLSLVPFIPLGFNRIVSDGERYTYLPSVFFLIALSCLLSSRRKRIMIMTGIFIFAIATFATVQRSGYWREAGSLAAMIIRETSEQEARAPESEFVFILAPDTVNGAHVLRNGLAQALSFRSPEIEHSVHVVPVYISAPSDRADKDTISWQSDERGFFAESADPAVRIVGRDREVTERFTYELWGYDYSNFTSGTLRLIFTDVFRQQLLARETTLLTWDAGHVVPLLYPLPTRYD